MYESGYYAVEAAMYSFLGVAVVLTFIAIMIAIACEKRKSKKYREVLGDMYVAAKIREIAKDEDISLDNEYKDFLKWCKKKKYEFWTYDSVIEGELIEKVETKLDKKDKLNLEE